MASSNPLARLFRACNPNESLQPSDPRYVHLSDVRGTDLVKTIARSLRMADPTQPDVKLFAGHRGIGKTSELYRLRQELQNSAPPLYVVYADVTRTLDVNDLDFPDLLVFVASEVHAQLSDARIPGFTPATKYLQRVWDDLRNLLGSDVVLQGGEADIGYASLAVELKNRPNARTRLREAIEKQATHLLAAVNDLLGDAVAQLRRAQYEGLVLIIDGLDKLVLRAVDDGGKSTHERLFLDRSEQLAALNAHVVYTVPISLFYSPRCGQLAQTVGEFNVPLPMIRLRDEHRSAIRPATLGMQKLWEIIDLRCKFAGIDSAAVFDDEETCHDLCEMSGGHPRHLMMFLQSALSEIDALPITREAVEQAIRNYANSLLREIPDKYWSCLRDFDEPQDDIPKTDDYQEMLFLLHIFEYMNGRPWYEVNPVLRTLEKYQQA